MSIVPYRSKERIALITCVNGFKLIIVDKMPLIPSIGNRALLKKNIGNTIAFITVSYITSFGKIRLMPYAIPAIEKAVKNTKINIRSKAMAFICNSIENNRLTILIIPTSRNVQMTASKSCPKIIELRFIGAIRIR